MKPALLIALVTVSASVKMTAQNADRRALPKASMKVTGKGFAFVQRSDRVVITRGGESVAEYVFDDEAVRRPFFANVCLPGGVKVTRNFPPTAGQDATDHADMHPGIWLGFGDISGHDFWRNKARIRHDRFTETPATRDDVLRFATESTLLTPGDESLARLDCRFTLAARADGMLLIWSATVTPTSDGFYFGDQEEMGFGVRVATPLTEKSGGEIVSSDGAKSAKLTWGQPAAWCDYSGTIEGQRVGVAIFPSLKNFRPSWWHNRDYGVFVANAFGRKAMKQGDASRVEVRKGEGFPLRFGAFIHATGGKSPADVAAAYADFCAVP